MSKLYGMLKIDKYYGKNEINRIVWRDARAQNKAVILGGVIRVGLLEKMPVE